ncbi:MAG TPA: hypothetical protein VGJ59_05700 [Jatrophihabitantaceae bacterium]|jgi:hypothetical protein
MTTETCRELPDLTSTRIAPETAEPGVDPRPRWRRYAEALVPPLVALLSAWAFIAWRSPYRGWRVLAPSSYGRWDTGQYLHIARSGYNAVWHCPAHVLPAHLPPGNYLCGTIGWFPGYPYAMRGLSTVTGLPLQTAGLVIAWACWYLVLVLMWGLLSDARSIATRWMCLLIAAFFPGQIYFAAIFPISMCIAGILGCLYIALRTSRRALAWVGFAAGFIAAYSYITAVVLAPTLLIVGLLVVRGRRRFQLIIPALGAAAGFGAVLLTMQVAVGIWNAYFISAKKYNVGAHMPLDTLIRRLRPLWTPQPSGAQVQNYTAAQTLLTLCFVGLVCLVTIACAVRGRDVTEARQQDWSAAIASRISAFDLTFVLMAIGVWFVPYIAGGSASTYRSEAFVVVCVPLLRRLPAWLLVVPLGAAVWVAWHIAPNFFNYKLQ